jgi:hypothetical protein
MANIDDPGGWVTLGYHEKVVQTLNTMADRNRTMNRVIIGLQKQLADIAIERVKQSQN